jgi:hypothetical protein
MLPGDVAYRVTLDTAAFTKAMEDIDARLAKMAAPPVPDEPIGKALLGAAAAAVVLSKPISRRRLLFPWSRA